MAKADFTVRAGVVSSDGTRKGATGKVLEDVFDKTIAADPHAEAMIKARASKAAEDFMGAVAGPFVTVAAAVSGIASGLVDRAREREAERLRREHLVAAGGCPCGSGLSSAECPDSIGGAYQHVAWLRASTREFVGVDPAAKNSDHSGLVVTRDGVPVGAPFSASMVLTLTFTSVHTHATPEHVKVLKGVLNKEISRAVLGADIALVHDDCETMGRAAAACCSHKRGFWWHDADCPIVARRQRDEEIAARRAREAPLVALVNSPPVWADPVAWRAAALAASDWCVLHERRDTVADAWGAYKNTAALRLFAEGRLAAPDPGKIENVQDVAVDAYRRALASARKVAPERATRGPVVVCDSGWDE